MTIASWPTGVGIKNIDWDFIDPAQVNRSVVNNKRSVAILTDAPMIEASFELVPIMGVAGILNWRAFIFQLRGVANKFRLLATEGAQPVSGNPVVNGAGQTGLAISTSWGISNATVMKAGMLATINDQLLGLQADVVTNGSGIATMTFHRAVLPSPANGAAIEVRNPTALVARKSTTARWSVDPAQLYGVKLEVEESL